MYENPWWFYLPYVLPGEGTKFDLCGVCGVSRDRHPRVIDPRLNPKECVGLDWRKIGYVGDYGDPEPSEFEGNAPFRDPKSPRYHDGEYHWWELPDKLPSEYR